MSVEKGNLIPGFRSNFSPSPFAEGILRNGRIIDPQETPQSMVERMVTAIFKQEMEFGTPASEISRLMNDFGAYLDGKFCVMSTPIMTNAGRYVDKPLSACTIPPVDLKGDFQKVKQVVDRLHQDGMGTGFNLDETEDPVRVLKLLNNLASEGAHSGKEDRPVGNIGILSVHHPQILNFVEAALSSQGKKDWRFNISVDASKVFMLAAAQDKPYFLRNGKQLGAREVMRRMAECAVVCSEPGIIFGHRLDRDNPTPGAGMYVGVAPCGEVGLAIGEVCQFGYINLGKFTDQRGGVDYSNLERLTRLMTRALDNALEYSLTRYSHPESQKIMRQKRKIGIGICGLADFLFQLGLPYDDPKSRALVKNAIAFINYVSKLESCCLAVERGSFEAMAFAHGCRYNDKPGFIEEKYGGVETEMVSSQMWRELASLIRTTGFMRNASTTALPPTGRSGLVIGASTGVEPAFALTDRDEEINEFLKQELEGAQLLDSELKEKIVKTGCLGQNLNLPEKIRKVFQTAVEISPQGHLLMVSELQQVVDESIAKTINLPEDSTWQEVMGVFFQAYNLGLKGVTVFRKGSRTYEPKRLAEV